MHFFPDVYTFLDSWTDDGRYQCDIGWQNFQAGCYRLSSDKQNWIHAEKNCQKMDAHLVSIHTLPELEFINMHMKRGAKTYTHTNANNHFQIAEVYKCIFLGLSDVEELWIGLHDTAMQMNFEWTDSTPVIFTFWHPFEPNNFLNTQEDCVIMWGPVSFSFTCTWYWRVIQNMLNIHLRHRTSPIQQLYTILICLCRASTIKVHVLKKS